MRVFVAADITDNVIINNIISAQSVIGGRNVKQENLHFTLQFLGEVDESSIPDIINKLQTIKFDGFDVTLHGIGTFGRPARLIWVGVTDHTPLQELSDGIGHTLEQKSNKKFTPHLTISRLKKNDKINITPYKDYTWGVQHMDKFKIKRSVLAPTGPVYTDVAEVTCN